jgi:thiol-disulfide isomerase/thioredoxin
MHGKMPRNVMRTVCMLMLILVLALASGCGSGSGAATGDQNDQTDQVQNDESGTGQADDSEGLTSFKTKDIYGNDVNQDLFQNYDLTLVNVWGTFCGPCLDELPFLGELQKEYESKGVNIVGIVCDVQDENLDIVDDQISLAKKIAKSTGADYTHMIVSNDMLDPVMSQFNAIPASFFVDSSGNIISEFYIGSRSKEDWIDLIDENLKNLK